MDRASRATSRMRRRRSKSVYRPTGGVCLFTTHKTLNRKCRETDRVLGGLSRVIGRSGRRTGHPSLGGQLIN